MTSRTIPSSLQKVQNYERFCEVVNVMTKRAIFTDMESIDDNPYHPVRNKFHHDLYKNILAHGAQAQLESFALNKNSLEQYQLESLYFKQLSQERLYHENRRHVQNENHLDYIYNYQQAYHGRSYGLAFIYFQEAPQIMEIENSLNALAPKIMHYTSPKHIKEYQKSKIPLIDARLRHPTPEKTNPSLSDNTLSLFSIGPDKGSIDMMLSAILHLPSSGPSSCQP